MSYCFISDLHLGTYGSEADEVLAYLDTIDADKIVINGDFVDIMLFNKRFRCRGAFPREI